VNTAIFVAIYCRVSTRDKGQDFTNQLLALREFASKQGWTIVNEHIDQQSAKDDDRPAFRQMFQDASQRRFDVLLFWSLDRLSREGVLETLQPAAANVVWSRLAILHRAISRLNRHFP
jgi:DNA invertase Pin-like site-specific DNA recombinase